MSSLGMFHPAQISTSDIHSLLYQEKNLVCQSVIFIQPWMQKKLPTSTPNRQTRRPPSGACLLLPPSISNAAALGKLPGEDV